MTVERKQGLVLKNEAIRTHLVCLWQTGTSFHQSSLPSFPCSSADGQNSASRLSQWSSSILLKPILSTKRTSTTKCGIFAARQATCHTLSEAASESRHPRWIKQMWQGSWRKGLRASRAGRQGHAHLPFGRISIKNEPIRLDYGGILWLREFRKIT